QQGAPRLGRPLRGGHLPGAGRALTELPTNVAQGKRRPVTQTQGTPTMRRCLPGLLSVLAGAALAGALNVLSRAGPPPASRFDWAKAAPETQGLSGSKLETLRDALAARRTKALLIIRNDRILLEWYESGHGPRQTHYTASLVKALVGALLLLLGLDDGRFDLDEPVAKYVPQW